MVRGLLRGWAGPATLAWGLLATASALAQAPTCPGCGSVLPGASMSNPTVEQLLRMSGPELDQLYQRAAQGVTPCGKVRGIALPRPGSRLNPAMSRAARVVWQGKIFRPDATLTNRFFGMKAIEGVVYPGESWMDGQPALIIDYSETSRLYSRYRDEIRQVAPDLYLGLMYDRCTTPPALKTYFALDTRPR